MRIVLIATAVLVFHVLSASAQDRTPPMGSEHGFRAPVDWTSAQKAVPTALFPSWKTKLCPVGRSTESVVPNCTDD